MNAGAMSVFAIRHGDRDQPPTNAAGWCDWLFRARRGAKNVSHASSASEAPKRTSFM